MGTPKLKLAVEELEMDHLILQIQNGRMLDDLSQTETEKLKSYASKKFQTLLGEIPKAPFPMIQGGSVYLMDKWIEDPSDKEDEMKKTCEGESSKSVDAGLPRDGNWYHLPRSGLYLMWIFAGQPAMTRGTQTRG
ncbi:hypothetical protein YC2023_122191 [Brassica napus]